MQLRRVLPPDVSPEPAKEGVNDEIFGSGKRGRLVLDGVDLQAREPTFLDEEQNTVTAPTYAGGDQNSVSHRSGERARSASHMKIDRCASASAVPGHDRRGDLSPKFVGAGEVLDEKGQDHGLFLG